MKRTVWLFAPLGLGIVLSCGLLACGSVEDDVDDFDAPGAYGLEDDVVVEKPVLVGEGTEVWEGHFKPAEPVPNDLDLDTDGGVDSGVYVPHPDDAGCLDASVDGGAFPDAGHAPDDGGSPDASVVVIEGRPVFYGK